MAIAKTATLTFRIDPGLKEAPRTATQREHRSIANVVEMLIRGCYGRDGIAIAHGKADVNNKRRWCMNRNWPATNPTHRSITYQERTTMACRARPSG